MKKLILIIDGEKMDSTFRAKRVLAQKYWVEEVESQNGLDNFLEHLRQEGKVPYYSFLEPAFDFRPRYSPEMTNDGVQTGYFLNRDVLAPLKIPVIIWTYPINQYIYGLNNFPERKWDENVIAIHRKSGEDNSMVDIINSLENSKLS